MRVLEFRAIGPAPFASMLLADLGAEILQVAPPERRAAELAAPAKAEDPLWRGRSHLALDLKAPAARDALLALLPHVDVLIEGYRPGAMERLGLGPDDCLAHNPALVYGRMTGWGQSGPLADLPSHDPNCLAITGALHAMGHADRPPLPPLNLVADLGGGALYLVMGVLAALLHARSSGQGQVVDAAMVDGVASLMGMVYAMRAQGQWQDERGVNFLDGSCPFGTSYETADCQYMLVCAVEPPFYARLIEGLGLDAAELPAQYERSRWPELRERFAAVFKTRSRDEWTAALEMLGACVSPVLSLAEAPLHPHNRARGVFVGDGHPVPAAAPRLSATPAGHAPATLGAPHDLLRRWGVADPALQALPAASP
ncbi:CaiB/BaiF CoA transferase family protein [Aquabacterium sp.]|uniref:CaiB/BaiF CoA transferase family protein n=1 Tax=Aquabacterium sp. TaxID=1872578 RepID=UPI002D7E14FE|nr:CaiB/BaiF CoA-transferase family protein [Aquabacterium sp.]